MAGAVSTFLVANGNILGEMAVITGTTTTTTATTATTATTTTSTAATTTTTYRRSKKHDVQILDVSFSGFRSPSRHGQGQSQGQLQLQRGPVI